MTQTLETARAPSDTPKVICLETTKAEFSLDDCVKQKATPEAIATLIGRWFVKLNASEDGLIRKRHEQYDIFDNTVYKAVWRIDERTATDKEEAAMLVAALDAHMKVRRIKCHEDTTLLHKLMKATCGGSPHLKHRVSEIAKGLNRAFEARVRPGGLREYLVASGGFAGKRDKPAAGEESPAKQDWHKRATEALEKLQKRSLDKVGIPDNSVTFTDADEGQPILLLCTYVKGMAIINGVLKHDKDAIATACVSWGKAHEKEGDLPAVPAVTAVTAPVVDAGA